MTAHELTPSEFEILSHYEAMFRDESLWLEPDPRLEDAVAVAISIELQHNRS
jgi:hypothetical protein